MAVTTDWKVVKTDEEIDLIRQSSRIVAETLNLLGSIIRSGVTTRELDKAAEDFIRSRDGIPSFKGYRGFPASICTSVNSEVVHGIPGGKILKEGDIISIDIGVLKEGYHGDGAATFAVGKIDRQAANLLETTKEALLAGISQAKENNTIQDMACAIQSIIESAGLSVVRDLVGHGIGQQMHEQPQVPNFRAPGASPVLVSGMTLAVEPMVNIGSHEVMVSDDGWTVVTKDGALSAHFEHTIAIGKNGAEILTRE
jgi:methionyl aminopeptidase